VSEEEEVPGVSEEEEEPPPVGVEEKEEPPPTSLPSHPSQSREEEQCGGDWSFPSHTYVREEEWCGGG
jgi:hypothetical protein